MHRTKLFNSFRDWFTNYSSRKLEWCLSFYTTIFGAWLLLPGVSMVGPNFEWPLYWRSENEWGIIYASVGLIHGIALHVNGRAAWTPFARALMLMINSQVFFWLAAGLAKSNPIGTGVVTYGCLATIFCGASMWSACVDCGKEISVWSHRRKRNTNDGSGR